MPHIKTVLTNGDQLLLDVRQIVSMTGDANRYTINLVGGFSHEVPVREVEAIWQAWRACTTPARITVTTPKQ